MPHATPLQPHYAARNLHTLCQAVPLWPYGALGLPNILRLVSMALQHPHTAPAGRELALFAWAQQPLNTKLLHIVKQLHIHHADPLLATAAPMVDYLQHLARHKAPTQESTEAQGPQAALWQARLSVQALVDNSPSAPETLEALKLLHCRLSMTKPGQPPHPWAMWTGTALAHCHLVHGNMPQARDALWSIWHLCPSHPNMILALHDLVFPLPNIPSTPKGLPPALLLYSWNKVDVLAQTLQSLRASDMGGAPVFVLNNGSTDGTAELLHSLSTTWGDTLHCVDVPVNIGAPAARNWLLSLPEVRQHDNIVFLDDDLLLDHHWLHHLQTVAAAHPKADTIGCRITGHEAPYTVQGADFFLLPPEQGDKSFVDIDENLHLHCASMGTVDTVLSRYTRPCLSVSGCCHWIRMSSIAAYGDFDVRFSPSQFDDAERDMRSVLHGGTVLYCGQISIRHVQHSSLKQAHNRAKAAHIFGNKLKLEFLYEAKKVTQLRTTTQAQACHDLIRKATRLASASPEERPS
ncbi:MAG: glycosyltransferase family A protein [Desulfovibrionaceae bacterium]